MPTSWASGPAYRVLGPVHIVGQPAARSQQTRLLAVLLLEPGGVVSTEQLGRWALGPDRADDAAQVQVLVARLRRLIRDRTLPGALTSLPGGYRFACDGDAAEIIDASRFEALLDAAQERRDQAPGTARRLLAEAAALWRGDVASGLGLEDHPAVARLTDRRLDAQELRFVLHLGLGQLDCLPELLHEHRLAPDRERLAVVAMSALFLAGRQREALAVFQRARQHTAATTGLEPGEALRRAEAAVLRHDIEPILRDHLGIRTRPSTTIGPRRVAPPPGRRGGVDATGPLLPRFTTSFVGRLELQEAVRSAATRPGLVTLVGPGGVGKTRLVCESFEGQPVELRPSWFCEVSVLADEHLPSRDRAAQEVDDGLGRLVARAVGARLEPGRRPIDAVATRIADKRGLLVLDSCETQVGACATLCGHLLATCPSLTIVSTSRAALGVAGEQVVRVPPLDPDDDAAELFLHRAIDADPGFALVADDVDAVTEVCRRLDGLPLAIELAAARTRTAGPRDLLGHLDDTPLGVLRTTRPAIPERHQSLERTVDWSYRLLTQDQQALLRRMGAFSGSVDIEDLAAVCAQGEDRAGLLDQLGELVERSMVATDRTAGTTRYRLLDTIRDFAMDRAAAAGEGDDVHRRHAEHYARRLEELKEMLRGPAEAAAAAQLDQLWPQLRTAVRWSIRAGDAGLAVRLLAGLGFEAVFRERGEIVQWADEVLSLPDTLAQPHADELLGTAGLADWGYGLFDRGLDRAQQAVALHRERGTRVTPDVAAALPLHLSLRGDIEATTRMLHAHSEEAAQDGVRFARAHTRICEAMTLGFGGAPEAEQVLVDAERLAQDLGCPLLLAIAAFTRAIVVLDSRAEEAVVHARRCLALAESVRATWFLSAGTNYLVAALARSASPQEAIGLLRAGLERQVRGSTVQSVANSVRNTVVVLDRLGRAERAGPLIGWLEVNRPSIPGTPGMRSHPAALAERLRAQLGERRWLALRATGADLTVEALIRAALEELDDATGPADGRPPMALPGAGPIREDDVSPSGP